MTRRIENSSKGFVESDRRAQVWTLLLLVACHWSVATSAAAATKVFLHDTASPIQQSPDYVFRQADANQGASLTTAVTASATGPLTGHRWPGGFIITKTSGGTKTIWLSPPLSAGVTISGVITPNLWGLESAATKNCGARYEVRRWGAGQGGIQTSLGISADDGLTEWGTAAEVRTGPTLTPTSTAFSIGDRIVMIIFNDDGNAVIEASAGSWTLDYNAATGADGDTYLSFTETITFSAEANNAPALPMTSWNLLPKLADAWREFWDAPIGQGIGVQEILA